MKTKNHYPVTPCYTDTLMDHNFRRKYLEKVAYYRVIWSGLLPYENASVAQKKANYDAIVGVTS